MTLSWYEPLPGMMTTCPMIGCDTASNGKRRVAGAAGGGGAAGEGAAVTDGEGVGEGDDDTWTNAGGDSIEAAPAVSRAAAPTWPQPGRAPTINHAPTNRLVQRVRNRNSTTTPDTAPSYGRPYAWG